jgi:hypothetical protein
MRTEKRFEMRGRDAKAGGIPTQYSEFVDRVNAQRFKKMFGPGSFGQFEQSKLGTPFSIDRPEAAAAHRALEHELKPAARRHRNRSNRFSPSVKALSTGVRASELFIAVAGFFGLMCAYAIQRSLK